MESLEYKEETAYVRVIMLVLAVMAFSYVWEHDHPPVETERTVVSYQFEWPCHPGVIESSVPAESIEGTFDFDPLGTTAGEISVREAVFVRSATETETAPRPLQAELPTQVEPAGLNFPVPVQIAAGEYRVIDQNGTVRRLTIGEEQIRDWGLLGSDEPAESYITRRDASRWHFIRVEVSVADVQQVDEGVVRERVKDTWKTLFRTIDHTLEPKVREVSRPIQSWLQLDLNRQTPPLASAI